ncbi:MAG: ABC transporter permease [Dehalococcoidales bacterium]|nr:MAG: ABC transporter permease [Dehalococcoidales bacterium]
MRILTLAVRALKENYRDPLALGFLLGFPAVFMFIFVLIFGGDVVPNFEVGVVDKDGTQLSQVFIDEVLTEMEVLTPSQYESNEEALDDLKLGELSAVIEIPEGFGDQVGLTWEGSPSNIVLDVTYDESDIQMSQQLLSIITSAARGYARIDIPVTVNTNPIHIETDIGFIDFMGPGIIVFGLLIMIPTSARIIVTDREKGFLSRLLTTPARPLDFILSYSLCLAIIAVAQIIIFIILATIFGMDIIGNVFLAFLVFFLTGLCSIGIGMIIGAISKSNNQAEPLTWLFSMPLAMLSGCWFSVELMPPYLKAIASIFPYIHTIEAARGIINRGVGLEAIGTEFLILACWAAGAFIVGIFLFGRTMRT